MSDLKEKVKNNSTITVSPLYEGTFSVGLDKKFHRIDRDEPASKGALKLSINPFLIQVGRQNILFDAGLGEFGEDTGIETILGNLEEHDLTSLDITDIFISHLHYDHLGGLAGRSGGYPELTFPDAKVWVNDKEWERVREADGATEDESKRDFFHYLDAHADLHFLDGNDRPYPEIRVKEVGGHTRFSQVLFFEKGDQKFLMAGDVIGRLSAVKQKFSAKFDFDPERSMQVREELKHLAWKEQYVIMAYHETKTPLFRLSDYDEKQGYLTEPYDLLTR